MILSIEHDILISGTDLATVERLTRLFFEKSQLVHYDSITIDHACCINATAPQFSKTLEEAVEKNHQILTELLGKLNREGCRNLEDILTLPQGFQSKILHTMSHLLDGFFGIDSRLYDIDEMSHWITDNRRQQILNSPETCWLIPIKARSVYGQGFEKKDAD